MEELKSLIPPTLKQKISDSTAADVDSTCSSLLEFFTKLPLFYQLIRDLTDSEEMLCRKNKAAALEDKGKGNECFSKGDYSNALHFYSQALCSAPMDVEDNGKNLVATLYLNRGSTLHKLGLFPESLRDCSRSLMLSPVYAKAWFRRGKANSSLGNYEDAINDFSVSLKIETSLSGKRQIESELNLLLDQPRLRSSTTEKQHDGSTDETLQMELQSVSTPSKGRGTVSSTDIPVASLIYKEDPYAAIILKHCRKTHCAFCFNELPADTVPCVSCTIPLYCSLKCQVQAGGEDFPKKTKHGFPQDLSDELERHMRNVTSPGICSSDFKHFAEHRHECQGRHWPAVLPPDVVLAGRILAKHLEEHNYGSLDLKTHRILDLCQNYGQLSSETKLEFHIYSIILLYCLQQLYATKLPLSSAITSEIILLLSKIWVNSMAVVRMKYGDVKQPIEYGATSSVEQIQVAQAVYSGGSLFNHSCQPNIHAYFLSRTLFIRATEDIEAGSELELSYGPQVGKLDCSERRKSLEDKYSFICQCSGCAQLNLSDLLHSGYRCIKPICDGVVLDYSIAKYEMEKINHSKGPNSLQKDNMLRDDSISKVAHCMFEQTDCRCLEPGHCLNCGTFCDLQASQKTITKADIHIQSMKDAMASGSLTTKLVRDALRCVDTLRTVLHPFNKRIAEVEDNISHALCFVGALQDAMDHCRVSLEILEKLYGENHIVIGSELIKLASIQLSMGREISPDYSNRILAIFSRHYGTHAEIVFPHVKDLSREAR